MRYYLNDLGGAKITEEAIKQNPYRAYHYPIEVLRDCKTWTEMSQQLEQSVTFNHVTLVDIPKHKDWYAVDLGDLTPDEWIDLCLIVVNSGAASNAMKCKLSEVAYACKRIHNYKELK